MSLKINVDYDNRIYGKTFLFFNDTDDYWDFYINNNICYTKDSLISHKNAFVNLLNLFTPNFENILFIGGGDFFLLESLFNFNLTFNKNITIVDPIIDELYDFLKYVFPSRRSNISYENIEIFPYVYRDAKNELLYYEEKYSIVVVDVSSCYSEKEYSYEVYNDGFLNSIKSFLDKDSYIIFYSGNDDSLYKFELENILNNKYKLIGSEKTATGSFFLCQKMDDTLL